MQHGRHLSEDVILRNLCSRPASLSIRDLVIVKLRKNPTSIL